MNMPHDTAAEQTQEASRSNPKRGACGVTPGSVGHRCHDFDIIAWVIAGVACLFWILVGIYIGTLL